MCLQVVPQCLLTTSGTGCSKVGQCYPPDSDFFQRYKNVSKAIKLQIWTWQLIKEKFNFKIAKFHLGQND